MTIFIDGFEQFRDDPMALLPLADYSAPQVSSAEGRLPGGASLLVSSGAILRTHELTGAQVSAGAAVKFTARAGSIFQLDSMAVGVDAATGRPFMGGVDGETIPIADRWYYFEIELDWTAGEARFYINGKLDITAPLSGSAPSTVTARMAAATEPGGSGQIFPVFFDDFYVKGGSALGPVEVATQLANQNASPQAWETSVPDASHADMVGIAPPDQLNRYVLSDEVGARDTYTSSVTASRNDEVKAVSLVSLARVTARTGQPLISRSGTLSSAPQPLTLNYRYYYAPVEYPAGTQAGTVLSQSMAVEVGAQ